jgi:hypothetical protein
MKLFFTIFMPPSSLYLIYLIFYELFSHEQFKALQGISPHIYLQSTLKQHQLDEDHVECEHLKLLFIILTLQLYLNSYPSTIQLKKMFNLRLCRKREPRPSNQPSLHEDYLILYVFSRSVMEGPLNNIS